MRFAGSKSLHRIELEPGVDVWTLFFVGPRVREWGFIKKNKWIHNETYLMSKKVDIGNKRSIIVSKLRNCPNIN